jgi:signal transduction histidine kinase
MPEFTIDADTRARYLAIISDEAARLERTIGDLLDLARLDGGGVALVLEDVAVEQLFDRVIARHGRASEDAGVRIVTAVEPGAELIRGDRTRLEQALQNLAANALRYAPHGSTLELRAAAAPDGTITVTVTDEGPGIPPEHLPRVFDRFYKVDASRAAGAARPGEQSQAATSGSGLGLSIVKAIIERHGGRVSVTSRPGKTTFAMAGLPYPNRQPS